jgi:hypothetical protein
MRKLSVSAVVVILTIGLLFARALGAELKPGDPTRSADKYTVPPPDGMRVSLDVLVNGRPVPLISHDGKLYLPVPKIGSEYEIRVTNKGACRVTAIVAVDGLSVITSEEASELQPGYLVDPAGRLVIKGWRRDLETVSAFTFAEREKSYAFGLGHPENIGVIGLIAIEEEHTGPRPVMRETAAVAKGADVGVGNSGTGWGRDIDSAVVRVPFVRGNSKRTITIYYDTPEALRRLGVPVSSPYPDPFPAEPRMPPPLITRDR